MMMHTLFSDNNEDIKYVQRGDYINVTLNIKNNNLRLKENKFIEFVNANLRCGVPTKKKNSNMFEYEIHSIIRNVNKPPKCILLYNLLNEKIDNKTLIDYMSFFSKNFLSGSLKLLLRCYRNILPNFGVDPKRVLIVKNINDISIYILGIGTNYNDSQMLQNMKNFLYLDDRKTFTRSLIKLGLFDNINTDINTYINTDIKKYLKHVQMSDAFFEYEFNSNPPYVWNEAKLLSDKVKFNGMELKKVFKLISHKNKNLYKENTWEQIKRDYKNITSIIFENISSVKMIKSKNIKRVTQQHSGNQQNSIGKKIAERLQKGGSPMTVKL